MTSRNRWYLHTLTVSRTLRTTKITIIMRVIRNRTAFCRPCLDASSETIHLNFHWHCVRIQMWSECANKINYIWRLLCTIWVICLCVISKWNEKKLLFCSILADVWSLTISKRRNRLEATNAFTPSNHVRCCSNQNTYVTIFMHFKMSIGNKWGATCFLRSNISSLGADMFARNKKNVKNPTIISIICRCPEWLYSVPTKLQLMNKRVHSKKNNAMIAGNRARGAITMAINAATRQHRIKRQEEWCSRVWCVCVRTACESSTFSMGSDAITTAITVKLVTT